MSAVAAPSTAQPERLPWPSAPLLELCDFYNGLWTGKKEPFETVNVIRNTNFTADGRIDLTDVAVLDVEVRQFAKRGLQKNDIIIEKSGGGPKQPVGRVVLFDLAEKNYSFSNFTSAIRVKKGAKLDPVFLHRVLYWWYLSGRTEPLQRRSTGIRNLDFNAYKELDVPLPPLKEQKRIVAVLDQAFAALDRARAHVEANLADASRLFDENRNQLLLQASVGSSESALGELCEFVRGPFGGSLKKSIFKPSGYAVYEQQHAIHRRFQQFRYFVDEEKFAEMMRFRVKADDLIMSCSGTIGKVAIVPKGAPDGIINQALLKLTTGPDLVPAFLQRWMEGAAFQQQLSTNTLGVAIENVASVKTLKTLTIPLLSIQIQHKVVERIEALEVRTSELAGAYRAKLEDLKSLRQSLLQKAFSGELT